MRILRLNKSRRGSAGITYGLAVGLIAVVAVTAVQQVGGAISGLTNSTAGKIQEVAGGTCPVATFTCDGRTTEPVNQSFVGIQETIVTEGRGSYRPAGEVECTQSGWTVASLRSGVNSCTLND